MLKIIKEEKTLDLIELFSSVQGETSLMGIPTTFVRLARCNLRCSWCDTPYAFGRGKPNTLSDILTAIDRMGNIHVCVTGGEPLLQPAVHDLMTALCNEGYKVSIETGGSLPIHGTDERVKVILDVKCPGSEMAYKNHWPNLDVIRPNDEVKFVIKDRTDYDYARNVCEQHNLYTRVNHILFSPVHDVINPQQLISWILDDRLPIRLNLQIHKYIWSPETQGV